jgi:hypothetical protein
MALLLYLWTGIAGTEEESGADLQQIKPRKQQGSRFSAMVKSEKDWVWSSHREAGITEKELICHIPIKMPTNWTAYVDEPPRDASWKVFA